MYENRHTNGYLIENRTDGILLWPEPFPTRDAAQQYLDDYLDMIRKRQGYWKTFDGQRIPLNELVMEIVRDGPRPTSRFECW